MSEVTSKPSRSEFDIRRIRADFPILGREVRGKPLVYLDNAASSQRPRAVIDAVAHFEAHSHANIHRGVYYLSEQATAAYEGAREKARRFLNAADRREIVFVRGTTEAVNLVSCSYARSDLEPGDEIVISAMEHHSNIVPWQLLCDMTGATLRVIPMDRTGTLMLDEYERILGPRTKLVALVHISNSLGTVNPVKQMIQMAKQWSIPVLLDGAQAAPHQPIDVQDLECDFYALSGHKMFGPTGIGVLYGRLELLSAMPPYQGGGEMIRSVTFEQTTFAPPPARFEAGTPNISGAVGLGAAIDYLDGVGWAGIRHHEQQLLDHALRVLPEVPGLHLIGSAESRASVISFVMDGIHAHDLGTIVDQAGVAIRTGHHCTQPVMDFFGVPATARASLAFYNTVEEIDVLAAALAEAREVFG